MGGRSSSYVYRGSGVKPRIGMSDTFDKDKESTRDLHIIQKVKNVKIKVMASSDIIPEEIIKPNLEMIDKIMTRSNQFVEILGEYNLYIRAENFSNPQVQAAFCSNPVNFDKAQIVYNNSFKNKTSTQVENLTKEMIADKWWTKSDKNNYINKTMAHEMSHFVQRALLDKICEYRKENLIRNNNPVKYEDVIAKKMKSDILKIAKKDYNCKDDAPSRYGSTNAYEFFAEAYSEVLCVEKEEKLSPIAKATKKYIGRLKDYVIN